MGAIENSHVKVLEYPLKVSTMDPNLLVPSVVGKEIVPMTRLLIENGGEANYLHYVSREKRVPLLEELAVKLGSTL